MLHQILNQSFKLPHINKITISHLMVTFQSYHNLFLISHQTLAYFLMNSIVNLQSNNQSTGLYKFSILFINNINKNYLLLIVY